MPRVFRQAVSSEAYRAKVAEALELDRPPRGERELRLLFLPSFDPELAITMVQQGASAELVVASLVHSMWIHLNGLDAEPSAIPQPAASIERVAVPDIRGFDRQLEQALAETETSPSLGLDGMPVVAWWIRPQATRTLEGWSPPADTALGRLCRELIALARANARWDQSRIALDRAARYLP